MLFGQSDWNGDGVIDSRDDEMELLSLMFLNDELEREENEKKQREWEERISTMVDAVRESPSETVETEEFSDLARAHGYYLMDFTQEDIDEISRRLESGNGYRYY